MCTKSISLRLSFAVGIVLCCFIPAQAATNAQIQTAIQNGVAWLAGQQNADGSWGSYEKVAHTGLAVTKLEEMAFELGTTPFAPGYVYRQNIIDGLDYIFANAGTYGAGTGVCFALGGHETYNTGISMMAVAASRSPARVVNVAGSIVNGWTYAQVLQANVDFFTWSQNPDGGWRYWAGYQPSDQSNSGYAVLGLAYAEQQFGIPVPAGVKTGLNNWINSIQDPVNGDSQDGGSWYEAGWPWVNELKTGNLIFQMTFVGDTPATPRFMDAMAYIERHWRDANFDPGWGYNIYPADYQAMYCLMKGLEYSGIQMIDTDGDTVPDDDWFNQEPPTSPAQDFASVLIAQQNADGSWPTSNWGSPVLSTAWALLTLEKSIPPPPPPPLCVNTLPASDTGMHSVTLWGEITCGPLDEVDPYRFHFWEADKPGTGGIVTPWMPLPYPMTYPTVVNCDVFDLKPGTKYWFWVQFKIGTLTNEWCVGVRSFTTLSSPVQIFSPNGGECILGGTDYDLCWGADRAVADVVLEYSLDDGGTWNTIATLQNDDANKEYSWTTPAADSEVCLVRISDAADPGTSDESDNLFCITTHTVPDVQGMSQADAEATVIAAGLTVGNVTYQASDRHARGTVWIQDPGRNAVVPAGAPVDLVVCIGKATKKPVAKTLSASNIGQATATLRGKVTDDGGELCQYRLCYWKSGDRAVSRTSWKGYLGKNQSFSVDIAGLAPGSSYWFWAEAQNSKGKSPGWDAGIQGFNTSP